MGIKINGIDVDRGGRLIFPSAPLRSNERGQPITVKKTQYSEPDFQFGTREDQGSDLSSWLGTTVISNLTFPSGSYEDLDGNTIDFQGIRIDTILFTVTQEKNIVKTKVQGADGTVKQYISKGDYDIVATGKINSNSTDNGGGNFTVSDPGNVPPDEEIRKLRAILEVPQNLQIVSDFLDVFGISDIVVDSFTIEEIEGNVGEYHVIIKMCSDLPVELTQV